MQETFLTDLPDAPTKRKNNPHLLRHTILITARNLILSDGIIHLSMQKVADIAGTSKGGLFHHFKSKDELIIGVFELFIAQLNTAILEHTQSSQSFGVFTKAYISVLCDNPDIGLNSQWAGLIRAMTADERLGDLWTTWLNHKLSQFSHSDSDPRLTALRYAIDGAWLNGMQGDELVMIRNYLLSLIEQMSV